MSAPEESVLAQPQTAGAPVQRQSVKRPLMPVIEIYRVASGTTRALLYFERSEEVCECVAEMILDRRLRAGVRSPPAAMRKITLALRDGVRFVEDERGLIVPEGMRGSEMARGQAAKAAPVERRPAKKRPRRRRRPN